MTHACRLDRVVRQPFAHGPSLPVSIGDDRSFSPARAKIATRAVGRRVRGPSAVRPVSADTHGGPGTALFVQWMQKARPKAVSRTPPAGSVLTGGHGDRVVEQDERGTTMTGVDPSRLDDQQLMKELENIHRTRHDTLLYGSNDALRAHNERMAQLEGEYLRRNPRRTVASGRTREGARDRAPGGAAPPM